MQLWPSISPWKWPKGTASRPGFPKRNCGNCRTIRRPGWCNPAPTVPVSVPSGFIWNVRSAATRRPQGPRSGGRSSHSLCAGTTTARNCPQLSRAMSAPSTKASAAASSVWSISSLKTASRCPLSRGDHLRRHSDQLQSLPLTQHRQGKRLTNGLGEQQLLEALGAGDRPAHGPQHQVPRFQPGRCCW